MSARCEKHAGQSFKQSFEGGDIALCHDCGVAELVAAHTIAQDAAEGFVTEDAAAKKRIDTAEENARIAQATIEHLSGKLYDERSTAEAYAMILRKLGFHGYATANTTFMRAAQILFVATQHGTIRPGRGGPAVTAEDFA